MQYMVRPSKVVSGKIYRQNLGYKKDDYYNGTFTVTFEASDPYGYLTVMTDDDLFKQEEANYVCNLLRSDMMPAAPAVSARSFNIYNPGTQACGVTFRLAGTAANGLTITNKTNNTVCKLRGLPPAGTLVINSDNGLITVEDGSLSEISFVYHSTGYVTLAPNDELNFTTFISCTSGSKSATLRPEVQENLTGLYAWLGSSWIKISKMNDNGTATLGSNAPVSGSMDVHLARMNEIVISGSGLTLTELSYSLNPKTL